MVEEKISGELLELAHLIEEHVRYFQEIGVRYLGGSAPVSYFTKDSVLANARLEPLKIESEIGPAPASAASVSSPTASGANAESQGIRIEDMPRKPSKPSVNLFGEPVEDGSGGNESAGAFSRVKTGQYNIPVLSTLPADASLEAIRDDIGECTRCRLSEGRTKIVFGEGDATARLMFVGEGPGADEDLTGRPFVGRAGKLLDKIIVSIGLRREQVYIANVVKCRPPGNRTPERDEVTICEQFLFRQIARIKPQVIVALGAPALQCLFGSRDLITRCRGEWRDWNGIKVMATYHPAYLLRVPDKKRETWEDMKRVRDYLVSVG